MFCALLKCLSGYLVTFYKINIEELGNTLKRVPDYYENVQKFSQQMASVHNWDNVNAKVRNGFI